MKDLRIVIPAYNEQAAIGVTLDRIKAACPDAEVVVVNDGSKDGTEQVAKQMGVCVVSFPRNRGYGVALKAGFKYKSGQDIKYVAFIDADSTYPPEKLPEMYRISQGQGVDLVIGSRFIGKENEMPVIRKLGNVLFAYLMFIYTRRSVSDTTSGERLFKASLIPEFENLPDGLEYTPAMTAKALHLGLSYVELPIEYAKRIGESKLHALRDGYRFLTAITNQTRKYKPSAMFTLFGTAFLMLGFLFGVYSLSRWFEEFFVIALLLIFVGSEILFFGKIAQCLANLSRQMEILNAKIERTLNGMGRDLNQNDSEQKEN